MAPCLVQGAERVDSRIESRPCEIQPAAAAPGSHRESNGTGSILRVGRCFDEDSNADTMNIIGSVTNQRAKKSCLIRPRAIARSSQRRL